MVDPKTKKAKIRRIFPDRLISGRVCVKLGLSNIMKVDDGHVASIMDY